jgi:hypothetical protein
MWERIRQKIVGKRQKGEPDDGISIEELASFVHFAATQEALQLVKVLDFQPKVDERLPAIFSELCAFYQYLVLIHAANVTELDSGSLSMLGGSLNLAQVKVASEPESRIAEKLSGDLVRELLSSGKFHHLVAAYLAGDTSISGLTPEIWSRLLKFTGLEKQSGDFMAMNHLVIFSRLLNSLGTSYGEETAKGVQLAFGTWFTHMDVALIMEAKLQEEFIRCFPGRLRRGNK